MLQSGWMWEEAKMIRIALAVAVNVAKNLLQKSPDNHPPGIFYDGGKEPTTAGVTTSPPAILLHTARPPQS